MALELRDSETSSRELLLQSSMLLAKSKVLSAQSGMVACRRTAEQLSMLSEDEAAGVRKKGLSSLRRSLSRHGVKGIAHCLRQPDLAA